MRRKGWRMSSDVGKATEGLENELWHRWNDWKLGEWAELHLRHNSFSNPSVASPTSQHILQPFFRFSYVTGFSHTSPGEPPMDICLTVERKLRKKIQPGNWPTGDRIRARCVRGNDVTPTPQRWWNIFKVLRNIGTVWFNVNEKGG